MKTYQLLESIQVARFDKYAAICANLMLFGRHISETTGAPFVWSEIHKHLIQAFKEWPEFSGWADYPVSDPKKRFNPRHAFCHYETWGKSAYAKKRLELLAYLINWFKERDL